MYGSESYDFESVKLVRLTAALTGNLIIDYFDRNRKIASSENITVDRHGRVSYQTIDLNPRHCHHQQPKPLSKTPQLSPAINLDKNIQRVVWSVSADVGGRL
jgi:hypothetical protein